MRLKSGLISGQIPKQSAIGTISDGCAPVTGARFFHRIRPAGIHAIRNHEIWDAGATRRRAQSWHINDAGLMSNRATDVTDGRKTVEFVPVVNHSRAMSKKIQPPAPVAQETEVSDEYLWGLISKTDFAGKDNQVTFLLKQQVGRALTTPVLGRMLLVRGMGKMSDIDAAIDGLKELANTDGIDEEVRARALGGISACVEAYTRLAERVFQISKECTPTKPAEVKQEVPKFYLQINNLPAGSDAKVGNPVEVKPVVVK